MESPVSLSTGVTYDRASIQRWLDSGNTTCPATMQVLSSTDLVPNLTLQRLIQIWSNSVRRHGTSPPPPPPQPDTDSPLTPEILSGSTSKSFLDFPFLCFWQPQAMESDLRHHQPMNPGLTRFRSAHGSFFASLLDKDFCDDFFKGPSSPETERILSRLISGAMDEPPTAAMAIPNL